MCGLAKCERWPLEAANRAQHPEDEVQRVGFFEYKMHQEHWEAASTRWIELAEFPNRARQRWPGGRLRNSEMTSTFLKSSWFQHIGDKGTLLLWFHSVFVIVKRI